MVFWRNIYGRKIQDLKIELFSGSKLELITWLVFEIWVRQIIISRNTEKKMQSQNIEVCFVYCCAIRKTASVLNSSNANHVNLKCCYFNFQRKLLVPM